MPNGSGECHGATDPAAVHDSLYLSPRSAPVRIEVAATTEVSDAIERAYRDDGARLWRAVLAQTGDRDMADDIVSEAFAQALGRGEALVDPRAWVWRAAFRIAMGRLKDARSLPLHSLRSTSNGSTASYRAGPIFGSDARPSERRPLPIFVRRMGTPTSPPPREGCLQAASTREASSRRYCRK